MNAKLVEFNKIMQEECNMDDVEILNFRKNFPKNDRGLWSWKDGLNFSEDKGIPILMCLTRRAIDDRPTAEKTPPPNNPDSGNQLASCTRWVLCFTQMIFFTNSKIDYGKHWNLEKVDLYWRDAWSGGRAHQGKNASHITIAEKCWYIQLELYSSHEMLISFRCIYTLLSVSLHYYNNGPHSAAITWAKLITHV